MLIPAPDREAYTDYIKHYRDRRLLIVELEQNILAKRLPISVETRSK
jgi:hypothetical protein